MSDDDPSATKKGIKEFRVELGGATAAEPRRPLAPRGEDASRFRVAFVSELAPRGEYATKERTVGRFAIDQATFDETMTSVAPELALRLDAGAAGMVALRFARLRDFRPEVLAKAIGEAPAPAGAMPPGAGRLLDDLLDVHEGKLAAAAGGGEVLVARVLGHEEVRRLEAAWRGLKLVVDRADASAGASVEVWIASRDEVEEALAAMATAEEGPPDLIVVDHAVEATARDLDLALRWARAGEGLGVPVVAGGDASLVGLDDLGSLARSTRRLRSADGPRAAAVRSLAARDEARWIALALNGLVARPRHTREDARGGVALEEAADLIAGGAIGVAMVALEEAARDGWACRLDGALGGLHVRMGDDRGQAVAMACEALVRDDVAAEAAAAGLIVLTPAPNKDVARLPYAPMLYRGRPDAGGASPAASLRLGDQLFVARIARMVRQVAAAIAPETPVAAAREVAHLALAEAFIGEARAPEIRVEVESSPPRLVVHVRPRGFRGVRLDDVALEAPFG